MRTRYMTEVFHPPSDQIGKLSILSAYKKMIEKVAYKLL